MAVAAGRADMAKSPEGVEGMRDAHGNGGGEPAVRAREIARRTAAPRGAHGEKTGPLGPNAFAASRKNSLDHQDP
ncbi:hypothetical protein GCM10022420_073090 [Streptomyces iranensis]